MKNEKLLYPTLAIQLVNEQGIPYEMPDDWLETVMSIGALIHTKYQLGIDIVYGMASKEGMNIINEEVENNE
tara:strand:+ start:61 stop:276 length:216 start_codon:yes stop_codon:yes gene_type:complete